MKPLSIGSLFTALLGIALAGCGHISTIFAPQPNYIADWHPDPSPLAAFLCVADEAATQLPLAESLSDWQKEYDNLKYCNNLLPKESLTAAEEKECTAIMEQMEIGKLALQMKRVEPKTGLKQCKLVAVNISKHVKTAEALYEAEKAKKKKDPPQDF